MMQIEPHVPVCDKSERKDGTFSNSDFLWDEQANEYRCPEGHALRNDWRTFKKPPIESRKPIPLFTPQTSMIVQPVPRKIAVARIRCFAKSHVVSTREHVTLHVGFT